jgi:endo-1,4-beta-xylanase
MNLVKMKIIFCLLFIASIEAALRDKAKRIYIGTAISPDHFSDNQYQQVAGQEFNCVTPENQMKWDAIEGNRGQKNWGPAEKVVQFAQQHGMKVRGHTLIWHSQLPGWVSGLEHNKTELDSVMKTHITEEMQHFKGKIYAWDVINEAFEENGQLRNSVWSRDFGSSFFGEAFNVARAADPGAKLYYNDYNIERINAKSNGVYNLVKQLKASQVSIDGVGFQSHFTVGSVPGDLQQNLQRFADLGLDVAITELDIRMHMPPTAALLEQQAKDYAHVFSACEAVSRCVGVTVWGFTDKYSWIPSASPGFGASNLFDEQYKPKPAVNAVNNVLH